MADEVEQVTTILEEVALELTEKIFKKSLSFEERTQTRRYKTIEDLYG